MERFFDILFSGVALIILMPLFVLVMVILRFTGEGEVFYFQKRVGLKGEMFGLFKFVTMVKNSSKMKMGTITVKNDPRVLPVGKFLRKTKLNELPQLLNVFLGDMSIIGPRPQTERCFLAFPKVSQESIIKVKPGLSGIGSIIFRDEESILDNPEIDRLKFYDEVIAPYKGELEQWFVIHRNLYIYFLLILLTVYVIVFPNSKLYNSLLKDLPPPPENLQNVL